MASDSIESLKFLLQEFQADFRKQVSPIHDKVQSLESSLRIEGEKHELGRVRFQDSKPSRLDFPFYDGSEDPTVWTKRANEYFAFHRTPIGHKVDTASCHLRGRAFDWFWRFLASRPSISWLDFVEGLQFHFASTTVETPSRVVVAVHPSALASNVSVSPLDPDRNEQPIGGEWGSDRLASTGCSDQHHFCHRSASKGASHGLEEGVPFLPYISCKFDMQKPLTVPSVPRCAPPPISNTREAELAAAMPWKSPPVDTVLPPVMSTPLRSIISSADDENKHLQIMHQIGASKILKTISTAIAADIKGFDEDLHEEGFDANHILDVAQDVPKVLDLGEASVGEVVPQVKCELLHLGAFHKQVVRMADNMTIELFGIVEAPSYRSSEPSPPVPSRGIPMETDVNRGDDVAVSDHADLPAVAFNWLYRPPPKPPPTTSCLLSVRGNAHKSNNVFLSHSSVRCRLMQTLGTRSFEKGSIVRIWGSSTVDEAVKEVGVVGR